jgi:hypothetical protein
MKRLSIRCKYLFSLINCLQAGWTAGVGSPLGRLGTHLQNDNSIIYLFYLLCHFSCKHQNCVLKTFATFANRISAKSRKCVTVAKYIDRYTFTNICFASNLFVKWFIIRKVLLALHPYLVIIFK